MVLTASELGLLDQPKSVDVSQSSTVKAVSSTMTSSTTSQPIASISSVNLVASDSKPCNDVQFCCKWSGCVTVFESLEALVSHVSDFHVKIEADEMYRCHWEGCPRNGKGFNARYKVLIHVRTHTNEKPHACYFCGKHFSRLESLKIHKRTHTGEKPYVCPYEGCNKAYSNSSDRFKHTLTHRVERPYSCKMPGCGKRYTDPSSLRKHIRAHGHHFVNTAAETSSDDQANFASQQTVTSSAEAGNVRLPACVVSSIIQDGSSGIAKIPQLPFAVAGLPALINGSFYMPNFVPNTLMPVATIPVTVNCSKIVESDRKMLADVSVLMADATSPAAVL